MLQRSAGIVDLTSLKDKLIALRGVAECWPLWVGGGVGDELYSPVWNNMFIWGVELTMRKSCGGFTLIELMIVVAIIATLAAIAYPSYTDSVRKARRADGKEALLRIHLEAEKWRANNTTYTCDLVELGLGNTSIEEHYDLALSDCSAAGFTATATGVGDQANDTGCTPLTLVVAGVDTRGPSGCW